MSEQEKEIEELDSFHFEGPGFNDEVSEITFPPTVLEMIENSGKFTKEEIEYLDWLIDTNTEAREAYLDADNSLLASLLAQHKARALDAAVRRNSALSSDVHCAPEGGSPTPDSGG